MGGRSASGRKAGGLVVTGSKAPPIQFGEGNRTAYERELMPFIREAGEGTMYDRRDDHPFASPVKINAILRRLPIEKRFEKLRELLTDDKVKHEHSFLYDMKAGQIVSRIDVGGTQSVASIHSSEWFAPSQQSATIDVVHVHNHPVDNSARRIGGPFSPSDIASTVVQAYERRIATGIRSTKTIALSNEGYYMMNYKMGAQQLKTTPRLALDGGVGSTRRVLKPRENLTNRQRVAKLYTNSESAMKYHSDRYDSKILNSGGIGYNTEYEWLRGSTAKISSSKANQSRSKSFQKAGQYVQGDTKAMESKHGRLEIEFIPSKDAKKLLK